MKKHIFSLGVPSCTFAEITGDDAKIEEVKQLVAQSGGRIINMKSNFYYVYNEKWQN